MLVCIIVACHSRRCRLSVVAKNDVATNGERGETSERRPRSAGPVPDAEHATENHSDHVQLVRPYFHRRANSRAWTAELKFWMRFFFCLLYRTGSPTTWCTLDWAITARRWGKTSTWAFCCRPSWRCPAAWCVGCSWTGGVAGGRCVWRWRWAASVASSPSRCRQVKSEAIGEHRNITVIGIESSRDKF